jgi:hypothetical protein
MKTMTLSHAQARYDAMEPPEDPYEDLAETDTGELYTLLVMAEDGAVNPDLPGRVRHQCDEAVFRLRAELERRACKQT